MSSVLAMVARVSMLLVIIVIIMGFGWPDITAYLVHIQNLINMLYLLNEIIDMDTFFTVAKVFLWFDIIWLGKIIIVALFHFVSSGSFSGGSAKIDNSGDAI